jgi:putative two-component system response regulator
MIEKKEKMTVLIAEDQKINREILKGILRQEYNVLEANNGEEALELLKTHDNVSAILTDLMMPKMDG